MTTTLPPRAAIAREHTWDLASIFATSAAWEQAFADVDAALPGLAAYQGRLGESGETLLAWFSHSEAVTQAAYRVFVYARLGFDVDTGDQQQSAMVGRSQGLLARLAAACAFAEPELLALPAATLQQYLETTGDLETYRHYLDNLHRLQPHVRSAEVEALLAQAAEPLSTPQNAYSVLADNDLVYPAAHDAAGEQHPVARGTIEGLLESPDRALRQRAWESYADAFLGAKNTMASLMLGNVRTNVFTARARNHTSALAAALHESNVPLAVYENVLDAYNRHRPLWHRYWEIRRRALGVSQLAGYDIFAPLIAEQVAVPFDRAVEWICAGMAPLGADYVETMRRGLREQRWVDIYPNVGKRNGAYSSGTYGTHPFILMSYHDSVGGMSTLAHELGHSMHSLYSRRNQPFVYSRYTLFVAEVASNFNQALVRHHLLQHNTERSFQINVIEEAMRNFHRYLFVMPILAQYERAVHAQVERGQAPTADSMTADLAELLGAGYGPAVAVDPQRDGIMWAQFQHMYMNFYVYQYASGIAAANALAVPIAAGDEDAVARYRAFLSLGGSRYPLDALQTAGIDMTDPQAMDRAFGVLASFVDRLDALIT